MSRIRSEWQSLQVTDRLLASTGLLAGDTEEEDKRKDEEEDNNEYENGGYWEHYIASPKRSLSLSGKD